jgi:hypothetical protein
VPRMLPGERKSKRLVAALTFLERYHKESYNFFGPDARSLRRWDMAFTHHPWVASFSFTVKSHKIQTDVVNPGSLIHRLGGGGTYSFPKAKPHTLRHIVQLWSGYDTPPKTAGEASCQLEWFCTTTRVHMPQLARVRYLLTFAWDFCSVLLTVRN